MSENSSALTSVTEPPNADSISANRSVIPPGWIPVPLISAPPRPTGEIAAL
jgi:hypothetical protein